MYTYWTTEPILTSLNHWKFLVLSNDGLPWSYTWTCPINYNVFVMACWWSSTSMFTFDRNLSIFETIKPLLNLGNFHRIVFKNLLQFTRYSAWKSSSITRNFIQYCCSILSVITKKWKYNVDRYCKYYKTAYWLTITN